MKTTLPVAGLLAVFVAGALACAPRDPVALPPDASLSEGQRSYLAKLAAQADAQPRDFEARRDSGLAHMRMALGGTPSLHERAELDLEAAHDIDPGDADVARSLGRFYNLRALVGDDSKADKQVAVYTNLLGDQTPEDMSSAHFVAWSFYRLGAILVLRSQGRLGAALREVRGLERGLAQRRAGHPDDIEIAALEGNFAFFFAGHLPTGKRARVRRAVADFEVLRERWADLRFGAQDPSMCPNTRENFMFELAEGHLALGHVERARPLYEELAATAPATRPKAIIAAVARERLRNAEAYAGDMRLMPPWPSDGANCTVCHAEQADIPLDTLHHIDAIELPPRTARD